MFHCCRKEIITGPTNAIVLIYNIMWIQNFITEINVKIRALLMGRDFCWVLCIHIHTQLQML